MTQCASGAGRHSRHSAPRRGIQKYPGMGISQDARIVRHYSTLCHLQSWAPLRMWGDTVRIGGGEALSSFRATTRNPEIPGHGITQDARAMRHYSTLCHPEAGPRIEVRGDTVRIGGRVTQRPHRIQSGSPSLKKNSPSHKKIFRNIWFIL